MTDGDPPTLDDVAELVRAARRTGERRLAYETAAASVGMSAMTWRRVEEAKPVRALTYYGVEIALAWPIGSIQRYLDGGPAPTHPEPEPTSPRLRDATVGELLGEVLRRHTDLEAYVRGGPTFPPERPPFAPELTTDRPPHLDPPED